MSTDKLFEFLDILKIRLNSVGGGDVTLRRRGEELVMDLPFKPMAVYGPVTAIDDLKDVNFSLILRVAVMGDEEPRVRITVRPRLKSWVWGVFEDDGDVRSLQEVLESFEVVDKDRQAVLERIK